MARTNYDLGPKIEALLADFCAACDGTPKVRVIRRAIQFYIDHRMSNESELARRMDEARRMRMAPQRDNIAILDGGSNSETQTSVSKINSGR